MDNLGRAAPQEFRFSRRAARRRNSKCPIAIFAFGAVAGMGTPHCGIAISSIRFP